MTKMQNVMTNVVVLAFGAVLVAFLTLDQLLSLSLFSVGLFWVYFFHRREALYARKFNRLSLFWILSKAYRALELIRPQLVRELVLIFAPYAAIMGLKYTLGAIKYEWYFLVGALIYETGFFIVKLVKPNQLNK